MSDDVVEVDEPEYLDDRRFFELVDLGGLPVDGTIAGQSGPASARPDLASQPTGLILRIEEACRTPYGQLSCGQVRTLLGQKMALEALAGPVLDFAARYPTAAVTNYPGEMGLLVLRAADEFLRHEPLQFRTWLQGDFGWMDEAFSSSRSLRREAEEALAAARRGRVALSGATRHMRRGSRADGALANPVRSGRKQP